MKATITYNQAQTSESNNSTRGLMNVAKGILISIAVICLVKLSYVEYQNASYIQAKINNAAMMNAPVYELTLPEVVITAPRTVQQEAIYEMSLPEVVIIGHRPVNSEAIYELTLPEVVVVGQRPVAQEAIYEIELPEVIVLGSKLVKQEATYELTLPEVVIVAQRPVSSEMIDLNESSLATTFAESTSFIF